ncbi:MAG: LptF/LptG family permease, partial [Bacteroidota bacterium]
KPDNHYVEHGYAMDTTLNMHPDEFKRRANVVEMMTTPELIAFQDKQEMQGAGNVNAILIERHKRTAVPFSTFILTIIGASISSRKIRGGTGMHLGLGLLIAFSYILFLQFSSQFAMGGVISPLIAVWIPNILYSILAFFIYRMGSR